MAGRAAYRTLRRGTNILFNGDNFAKNEAKIRLREEFLRNKNVTEKSELEKLFKDVEDVSEMINFNLVQGKLNQKGNFAVKLSPTHEVTLEAGQSDPHGPELEAVDTAFVGKPIKIEIVKGDGRKPIF